MKAHRFSWALHHGPVTPDVHILHKCDVRHCVAPRHLFEGDQDANMKDAAKKGRLSVARPRRRKLAPVEMQAILREPEQRGVVVRLAQQYGVTKSYVSLLRRGERAWRPASSDPASGQAVRRSAVALGASGDLEHAGSRSIARRRVAGQSCR